MAIRTRYRGIALLTFLIPLALAGSRPLSADEQPKAPGETKPVESGEQGAGATGAPGPNDRVVRSDAEWRRRLTSPQYMVTRQKATEPAWSGKYARGHFKGTFACVCCGAELFSAAHKFESGTGWPSFWRPIRTEAVITAPDYSAAEPRVEVMCARCDAHLGHVFSDGPAPTGLRFCLNSVALTLQPSKSATSAKPSAKSKSKTKGKPKSKAGDGSEQAAPTGAETAPEGGSIDAPARAPSEGG